MILKGNALDKLKKLEDNSVDQLVTDPPYGYSFMGKDWDKALPDIEIFKECLRVMKPGAFGFVMAAPRQDVLSRMMILLEDAGFNITFSSIYWAFATGFPKANNIGKAIDKKLGREREVVGKSNTCIGPSLGKTRISQMVEDDRDWTKANDITAPASDEAKAFDGSYGGFQPKPAVEVIIVIQKPCTEKTQAGQALNNSKGITWLDDCRIPYSDDSDATPELTNKRESKFYAQTPPYTYHADKQGRFPANLSCGSKIDINIEALIEAKRLLNEKP